MLDYEYHIGDGKEVIVLLHGIGGNSSIFYKQIDEYKKEYHVLAIHLPGHGASPNLDAYGKKFSFDIVVNEIEKTMDKLNIQQAHFVGISLGSIILHHLLQRKPERVKSAVLGGAVTRFNSLSSILLSMGGLFKGVTPHMWIYRLFANIMMPKANHKKSRELFIQEAQKMKRTNFLLWFDLIRTVEATYESVQENSKAVPKLYISGREDHLFLEELKKDIKGDISAELIILDQCGHVCNIEKADQFNIASLAFIKEKEENQSLPFVG
ncbi:alpha/beta fold hydrolase [Rossellomorea aquimaris]|uniref:alpha/beta fold hydrolase n=1 Tax=Rossellomorea aquimaris TaxID=189382 RepID=UPI0007D04FED|nr:alpha/beta hydrolase [Rossellomorea aquimaris]